MTEIIAILAGTALLGLIVVCLVILSNVAGKRRASKAQRLNKKMSRI